MLKKVYLLIGALLLVTYMGVAASGWELSSGKRQFVPEEQRRTSGGYRSFHYWHMGYRGGK